MSFRIKGLPAETFQHLFVLSDEELRARRALRQTVNEANAFPCRVSLTDAAPGEEVLLVNYEHHAMDSPYRSSFAVYIRAGEETYDAVDEVPAQFRRRMLAARGYDGEGMLVDAADGGRLDRSALSRIATVHSPVRAGRRVLPGRRDRRLLWGEGEHCFRGRGRECKIGAHRVVRDHVDRRRKQHAENESNRHALDRELPEFAPHLRFDPAACCLHRRLLGWLNHEVLSPCRTLITNSDRGRARPASWRADEELWRSEGNASRVSRHARCVRYYRTP